MAIDLAQLQNFRQLSRKQQYDAAYNAGAQSQEEADQMVQQILQLGQAVPGGSPQIPSQPLVQTQSQPQQVATPNRGGFRGLLDRLDNLSPEQGLGLLAFGTQMSQGVQPGQTPMSTFGQAAQTGFATTNALRQQQAQAAQAQLEQEMKMREALRARRRLEMDEQKLNLDQQRFGIEQQQAMRELNSLGIDPAEARYFTPGSLQEALRVFRETGDRDLAMTRLQRNPDASARTTNVINMPGTDMPPYGEVPKGYLPAIREEDGFLRPLSGREYMEGNFDPARFSWMQAPGGPQDRETLEQSAKAALLEQAKNDVDYVLSYLFDKGGDLDRKNLGLMLTNMPFTDGRLARAKMLDAMEGKIRAESGAAVPQEEVERAMARFFPSAFDNEGTVRAKLQMLEDFTNMTLRRFDPDSDTIEGYMAEVTDKYERRYNRILDGIQEESGNRDFGQERRENRSQRPGAGSYPAVNGMPPNLTVDDIEIISIDPGS